jgi:succinate dehydrogenase / fumarate reductase cytochrome b subunit
MGTNPLIRVVEPLLAIGFVVHILYAGYITLKNKQFRPTGFDKTKRLVGSSWASQNMFVLGAIIFIGILIHMRHFFFHMKLVGMPLDMLGEGMISYGGETMHNAYLLIISLFQNWYFTALYVIWAILLGIHISHGFWSAFQTLGFSNNIWRKRLTLVSRIFAVIFGVGFSIIPLYFLLFFDYEAYIAIF